jgi:hypothetical protein
VKEVINVYGEVILEQHREKNYKFPIGFSSLQARPVLLLPWLVQTILYLIADPVIFIFDASRYFAMGDTIEGAICIIAMVIYICK